MVAGPQGAIAPPPAKGPCYQDHQSDFFSPWCCRHISAAWELAAIVIFTLVGVCFVIAILVCIFNFCRAKAVAGSIPKLPNVLALDCTLAFQGLSPQERLYAHHLCRATFLGSLSNFHQFSQSPGLFVLFRRLFSFQPISKLKKLALESCQFSENELQALLSFTSDFIAKSASNFKGFVGSEFIPDVPVTKFEALLKAGPGFDGEMSRAWSLVFARSTDLCQTRLSLDFPHTGETSYASSTVSEVDRGRICRYKKENGKKGRATRLFKSVQGGKVNYEIRRPSVDTGEVEPAKEFEDCLIRVTKGDYSPLLKLVTEELQEALKYSGNEEERQMIQKNIEHLQTGAPAAYNDYIRHWIEDTEPMVESCIRFIESDGGRTWFRGFVAAANRATSATLARLADNAEMQRRRLPWGADYEEKLFFKPGLTSLEVISFAPSDSNILLGYTSPWHRCLRLCCQQMEGKMCPSEGFKNFSFGNVISLSLPSTKINFLTAEDKAIYRNLRKDAYQVQVGLHELIGHGGAKFFQRNRDGSFNFDRSQVKDLLTGKPISSWHEKGVNWSTEMTYLARPYKECRADAVGYVLCCYPDVLKMFGFEGQKAEDVKYCNWMMHLRKGLMALESFDPQTRHWAQAHAYGRYVLLRVALEAGEDFVRIEDRTGDDGQPDLVFSLDRSKIDSVGKKAVKEILKKLQLFQCTGDFENGKALFEFYGEVDELALHWRSVVVAHPEPRYLIVQPNTFLIDSGDDVELKTYPATVEGLIQSFVERFPDPAVDKLMLDLAEHDSENVRVN